MSPITKSVSTGLKNLSPGMAVVSPALRVKSETVWNVTPSKDQYDSDSQDVIFVDDNVDDTRTLGNNSDSLNFRGQAEKSKLISHNMYVYTRVRKFVMVKSFLF